MGVKVSCLELRAAHDVGLGSGKEDIMASDTLPYRLTFHKGYPRRLARRMRAVEHAGGVFVLSTLRRIFCALKERWRGSKTNGYDSDEIELQCAIKRDD